MLWNKGFCTNQVWLWSIRWKALSGTESACLAWVPSAIGISIWVLPHSAYKWTSHPPLNIQLENMTGEKFLIQIAIFTVFCLICHASGKFISKICWSFACASGSTQGREPVKHGEVLGDLSFLNAQKFYTGRCSLWCKVHQILVYSNVPTCSSVSLPVMPVLSWFLCSQSQ